MTATVNHSNNHRQALRPYDAQMESLLSSTKSDRGLNADLVRELVDEKNKNFIHYIDNPKFERALWVDYDHKKLIEISLNQHILKSGINLKESSGAIYKI